MPWAFGAFVKLQIFNKLYICVAVFILLQPHSYAPAFPSVQDTFPVLKPEWAEHSRKATQTRLHSQGLHPLAGAVCSGPQFPNL